ncbi:unnamed protein product [Linum trigynum]|uniref:Uncharacterized protein n=1 Tax=Linum trigynum TaxID=586398 RepID=A0AAV2DFU7_9ROSI
MQLPWLIYRALHEHRRRGWDQWSGNGAWLRFARLLLPCSCLSIYINIFEIKYVSSGHCLLCRWMAFLNHDSQLALITPTIGQKGCCRIVAEEEHSIKAEATEPVEFGTELQTDRQTAICLKEQTVHKLPLNSDPSSMEKGNPNAPQLCNW